MTKKNPKKVVGFRTAADDELGTIKEFKDLLSAAECGDLSSAVIAWRRKSTGDLKTIGFGTDMDSYSEINLMIDILKFQLYELNIKNNEADI